MKRKEFITTTAIVALGAPLLMVPSGCSSDEGNDTAPTNNPTGSTGCANGTNTTVTTNHGHSLTVSTSDVLNGTQKTYSIEGGAGHNHTVTVTASQFTTLQNNRSISVTSSTSDGHSHNVSVSCA